MYMNKILTMVSILLALDLTIINMCSCNSPRNTPQQSVDYHYYGPSVIVAGPDGNLWFTEIWGNKIGKISPQNGAATEYDIPASLSDHSSSEGIATGPDGNLWFMEYGGNRIGRISLADGGIIEYFVNN
jgi:streptogramin lyase